MRPILITALAFLAAGCATSLQDSSISAEWLDGTWASTGERRDCSYIGSVTYTDAGHFSTHDNGGTWRMEGNRLIETVTWSRGDPNGQFVPWSDSSRIYRTGPDTFVRIFEDGRRVASRRCP